MMTEPTHVDGNAAAGAFAGVVGFDVTTATVKCAGCGQVAPFAESHVYLRAPGIVVRCARCDHVLARLVQTEADVWLDLGGAQSWRIRLPARGW
jgi:phage FluMu protein Com